jgi:GMP synthase (glutamine-hydrolysing)
MRVLVLQHIACESPGVYEDVLRERGDEVLRVELDDGEPLPPGAAFDAIVAMGGPMSAGDDDALPWLVEEKRLIGDAVRDGVPFFGACLGVQLLAAALGARVYAGSAPELGLLPVHLTDAAAADPVFGGLPRELLTLQWHGDTFDLPDGAVLLARSPAYPHQAFRAGERAYGVQFHLEATPEMVREWATIPEYRAYAERTGGTGAAERLAERYAGLAGALAGHGRAMFARWAALAAGARQPAEAHA